VWHVFEVMFKTYIHPTPTHEYASSSSSSSSSSSYFFSLPNVVHNIPTLQRIKISNLIIILGGNGA
jgi:hypothetical protein